MGVSSSLSFSFLTYPVLACFFFGMGALHWAMNEADFSFLQSN